MDKEKHIKILGDFLQGKASTQEVRFLLSQLDDASRWDQWAKKQWEDAEENGIDAQVEDKMFSEIQKSIRQERSLKFRWIWNVAASVLIACLSLSTIYLLVEKDKEGSSKTLVVKVEKGQKATVVLPDSTLVWLNSDSELFYDSNFNTHERKVRLNGEAYFEVSHNPDCPFTVSSGGVDVTALGTSFNVKAYPEEQSITALLIEGKVVVNSTAETVQLLPGQLINYNRNSGNLTKTVLTDIQTVTAWREENKFVFEENSLLDITNMLSRQYNIQFEITEESLKDYQYSGTVDNSSLQTILEMISLTSPVSYYMNDRVVVLSENKQNGKMHK